DLVREEQASIETIAARAREAREALDSFERPDDELQRLRHDYLARQLDALIAYLQMLDGARLPFDEEAKRLYDAVPPQFGEEYFERILADIDELVPGDAPLAERVEAFSAQFVIPPERLAAVFEA